MLRVPWLNIYRQGTPVACLTQTEKITDKRVLLTLMLLVANLVNTKLCKKLEKSLKPWYMGTHLRVLSERFPMNTNMAGFR